jgi:hypothetical protein
LQSISHAAGHDFVEDRHDRDRAISRQIVTIAFFLVDEGNHDGDHLRREALGASDDFFEGFPEQFAEWVGRAFTVPSCPLADGRHDFEIIGREAIESRHCIIR